MAGLGPVATISGRDRCLVDPLETRLCRKNVRVRLRPALPGEAVMLGMLLQRRSIPRVLVSRTAWLTFKSASQHEHVALVKDISEKGVYFYSDFLPAVGDHLDFVVEYLSGSDRVRLHLKGAVMRVEQSAPGCAPGTAISFSSQRNGKR